VIQQNDTTTLLNQADSQTLIAQGDAVGSWQLLSYKDPVLPIHAALLHTGKVLFFSGSGNNPKNTDCRNCSAVWDVSQGNFSRPKTPLDGTGQPIDIFCAGQSFRPDGSLIVAGGTMQYDPFHGLPSTLSFNPTTEEWKKVGSMHSGRWYPTLITLGNGRVLALSGLDENGMITNYPEIYSGSTGWSAFSYPTSPFQLYSHLFLLSSGQLFYSGAYFGASNKGVTPRRLILPKTFTQAIAEREVYGLQAKDFGNQAASVLLPPAQSQKVMIIGGGGFTYQTLEQGNKRKAAVIKATNRVNIVDLTASNPIYRAAASLHYARMHHSAVLLPDRTVFVCNGSQMNEDTKKSMLPAEIYNPATNTWTVAGRQRVARVYHSVALLLPDGRVLTAGGNPKRTVEELRLEIYSPAYMSQTRPVIQSAPQTVRGGGTITIQTPQAGSIQWVSLIKPMATTHTCDTEQRLVDLPITASTSTSLTAEVTSNRNLAPPAWYMLFITDKNNVPSVANWIQLR